MLTTSTKSPSRTSTLGFKNNKCEKANIECKFIYENDNQEYTIVTKQSMRENSNVPTGTNITITLGK